MGRLVALGTVLAASCVAVGLAAADSPVGRTVQVGDGLLTPATVAVLVGGTVTWQDTGKQPHRVVSSARAWAPFTVRPGKLRTVKFPRTGRFRYRVDGKVPGLVLVVAQGGGVVESGGKWSGSFTSDGQIMGEQTCGAHWKGTISLTIKSGKLTGSGEAKQSGKQYCSVKLPPSNLADVTFTADGSASRPPAVPVAEFNMRMHPRTVSPLGAYDPGGFLLHFGLRGEGLPIVLYQLSPNALGTVFVEAREVVSTTVVLYDDFELKRVR